MRKILVSLLAVVAILLSTAVSYAASNELIEGMVAKLWRGVVNTFTGWVEFPAQIVKGYNEGFMDNEDDKIGGAIVGILDGIGHSAGRTLSGVTDIIGFWAAGPRTNEGIGLPLDAEYAWEEGKPYDLFNPDFTEATVMPVGKKLMRGLGNGLLGIAEIPGQIIKGISGGAPDLGIVKGIWYFYSREVAGLSDIATVILPNPEDTKGIAFDEEYPWEAFTSGMKQQ